MSEQESKHLNRQPLDHPNPTDRNSWQNPLNDALILNAEREAAEWESTVIVPTDAGTAETTSSSESWPCIPNYRIFRRLPAGGQGIIFLAVDERNEKLVAIKVLRDGVLASKRDRARFRREALILSNLQYPGILRIHDTGQVDNLDYLVTDFILGKPLLQYADEAGLSVEQRVDLFAQVCQAMKVAHSLDIVHRDLKPANILVDATGTPHIIDFGLAKSTAMLHHETAHTFTGDFVGSLPWASPEQADGRVSHIETKSDVYSLGVIFYQLLTGKFPYVVHGATRQVLENICNHEPCRPSSLRKELPKELDLITLKCLAKDRDQRYATAENLSDDLNAYKRGDLLPGGKFLFTQIVRMLRRHRRRLMAAAATFVILVTSATVIAVSWQKSKVAALAAQALVDAVQGLGESNPESRGRQLDAFATRARRELREYPEYLASVLHSIANAQFSLDQFTAARLNYADVLDLRRTIYAEPHEKIAESLAYLASTCQKLQLNTEANDLYQKALQMRKRLYAPDDRRIAQTLNNIATFKREQGELVEAITLFQEAQAIFEKTDSDYRELDIAKVLGSIGHAELDDGRCVDAQFHLSESLLKKQSLLHDGSSPSDLSSLANTQFQLARLHMECEPRDLVEAERLANAALEYRRQQLPATHFHAESLLLLARIRQAQGRTGDALAYIRACVEIGSHIAGTHHEIVLDARRLAASIYKDQGVEDASIEYRDPSIFLTGRIEK